MNRFRNDTNNLLLKGLFFETTGSDKSSVVYTLKDWDHDVEGTVYPSLYLRYMSVNDPTEYAFATEYLDGWSHWERLCECSWFKEYVSRWRKELELRMKSQALSRILAVAKTNDKETLAANRYLLEKGWDNKNTKGRPSKDDIRQAAHDIARSNDRISEDYNRIIELGRPQ